MLVAQSFGYSKVLPTEQVVPVGGTIKLYCETLGDPEWDGPMLGGAEILTDDLILKISAVTERNAGMYSCRGRAAESWATAEVYVGGKKNSLT